MSLIHFADPDGKNQTPASAATPLPTGDALVLAAVQALTAAIGTLVVQPLGGTLIAAASGTIYSNEGATAISPFVLPTAVAGLRFGFVVQDADGVRVTAAAGDTVRVLANVSAAAGKIEATAIGSTVYLIALNATEWVATSALGTWTAT